MKAKQNGNKLAVMMIYGWQANPYAECVVQSLLAHGLDVLFVTRKTLDWTTQEKPCLIFRIFPDNREGSSRLSIAIAECIALVKLIVLLLRKKPAIVHYQAFRIIEVECFFFLLLKILKKKVVFTIHDTFSLDKSSMEDFLLENMSRYCDALFVHTEYSKNLLREAWKMPSEKTYLIPHGSYESCYDTSVSRAHARENLGYQEGDYILLFFGAVRRYKGLDYLLPAVAAAKALIPNIRLIIAGKAYDRSLAEYYKQVIVELNLGHVVDYRDRFIEDKEVAELFSCCDIVVLPYTQIDQSGVLCLSFTFGRPVIATHVGGLPEMVHNGVTGYTVPPANSDALAEKITEAWHQRQNLEKMGKQARTLMEKEYSWHRLAGTMIEAYKKILSL